MSLDKWLPQQPTKPKEENSVGERCSNPKCRKPITPKEPKYMLRIKGKENTYCQACAKAILRPQEKVEENLFEWVGDACPLHPLFHATTSFLYGINLKIPICCVVYVVYCDLFNRAIPLEVLEAKDMIGYWTCPKHWSSWLRENVICDFFGQFNEVNECCRNCPGRRECKESRRKTHD